MQAVEVCARELAVCMAITNNDLGCIILGVYIFETNHAPFVLSYEGYP